MKIAMLLVSIFLFSSSAFAADPVVVNPYTFLGRVMDAKHSAFDTNRVATVEVADASGKTLARSETFFRADTRRNYALFVPMATTAVPGCAVQGAALSVSVTDDVGKLWSGVVVDASAGAPGAVREVDIVLGEDLDGDGIDDALYQDLLSQWEMSDYWAWGEEFDPKKDYDGDGISTIAEALSGTDPFNPEDVLKITGFSYSPERSAVRAQAALSFQGIAGHSYTVEGATNLSKKDWKSCAFAIDETGGEVNVISISSEAGAKACTIYLLPSSSNAVYRLKAE